MTHMQVLDWLCCITTLIGLYGVSKYRYMWIIYTFSNILYTYLMFAGNFPAMGFMGLALIGIGVHNFYKDTRKI